MSRAKASPRDHGPDPAKRLAPFVERLYAAPLDGFTATRKALAAELKSQGAKADAAALLAMKKPTRTAWALNHVARHDPSTLASFLEATEKVRAAQSSAIAKGSSAPLRDASRALNGAIATIVGLVKRALAEAGTSLTMTQQRIVMRTLHAIPFASAEEVDRLSRGTLVVDIDAPSDFGVFGSSLGRAHEPEESDAMPPKTRSRAHAAHATAESEDAPPEAAHREQRRAAAEKARAATREAQRAAAEAKAHAREATRLAALARRADEAAKRAEHDAEVASRQAATLASRARDARTNADIARDAAAKASAHLHRSAR